MLAFAASAKNWSALVRDTKRPRHLTNYLPPYLTFRCVQELKTNEKWVLPALKMMREICCLYEVGGISGVRSNATRQELIDRLQTQHSLVILVTNSLTAYMEGVRKKLEGM